jgi:hypothetical protein
MAVSIALVMEVFKNGTIIYLSLSALEKFKVVA